VALKRVAVIGLGYVGLPLCLAFVRGGLKVIGIDVDPGKIEQLCVGESYISHIPALSIAEVRNDGRFEPTTDVAAISGVDAIVICVPTPLTPNRTPDLSHVEATGHSIGQHLRRGQLVVLESTTYPGTTDEILKPVLERASGLVVGESFYLAYSPEREDPGNPLAFREIPKLVGGVTTACCERAIALYSQVVNRVVPTPDCRTAEAAKLLENIFRAVNIALVNELKMVYAAMGIDIWDVIAAAATKPYGFMPFYPGPGLGGHCIPIDPFYLTWKALEYGQRTRLIELAGEINTAMPHYVVSRITDALNDAGKPLKGSRVLLLGLAYKPNVDDDRESPTYEIMRILEEKGAIVSYNDPHIPEIRPGRTHHAVAGRRSVPIDSPCDVIVICTAHAAYVTESFERVGVPVVDSRNLVNRAQQTTYRA
jgi:UDP-N-acetyl-D-glucosamine dehydrogenase